LEKGGGVRGYSNTKVKREGGGRDGRQAGRARQTKRQKSVRHQRWGRDQKIKGNTKDGRHRLKQGVLTRLTPGKC